MTEHWYRVEATQYAAPLDEWDNPSRFPGPCDASLHEYPVIKTTPKGVWINTGWLREERKFVLRDARKRFACPTREKAFESFYARKTRHVSILQAQIAKANRLVAAARRLEDKLLPRKEQLNGEVHDHHLA